MCVCVCACVCEGKGGTCCNWPNGEIFENKFDCGVLIVPLGHAVDVSTS